MSLLKSIVSIDVQNKEMALQACAQSLASQIGCDQQIFSAAILEREKMLSTGIGQGIALPHARLPEIKDFAAILAMPSQPLAFDAIDDLPVELIIMIAAPEGKQSQYLQLLSQIVKILKAHPLKDISRQADGQSRIEELFSTLSPAS